MQREPLTETQHELYVYLEAYIRQHGGSPSIREMMQAMGLRSPAPVQCRLNHLEQKGWIYRLPGKARTVRLLQSVEQGIPIYGAIAAGGLVTTFATDEPERLDIVNSIPTGAYALRVTDDSMVGEQIGPGDVVLVRPVEMIRITNGDIAAVTVAGETTLKHFHRCGTKVKLVPANPKHETRTVCRGDITNIGIVCAVWRNLKQKA